MAFAYTIGIDEAGRGPLAGRVFVGVVALPQRLPKNFFSDITIPLHDSKALTARQREAWFLWMKKREVVFSHAAVSAGVIDRINISRATDRGAGRALGRVIKQCSGSCRIIADGSIRIVADPIHRVINEPRADQNYAAVALASIVAKVLRDGEMMRLARRYPQYGFEQHKGYGTAHHIRAIKKHGPCLIHRESFLDHFRHGKR